MDEPSQDISRQLEHHLSTATWLQDWPECQASLKQILSTTKNPTLALPYHAYRAVDGQADGIIPVTAAWVVLVHTAYLIDDLQEGELKRVARIAPPETAMTIAIAWIFAAYRLVDDPALNPEIQSKVVEIFSQAGFDSAHGQHLELSRRFKDLNANKQLEAYWQSVIDKSGSIYAAGAAVGAVVGTDSTDWIEALSDYGISLGVIMQVMDDIRDLWDDARHSHKSPTLPTILHELAIGYTPFSNEAHTMMSDDLLDGEFKIAQSLEDASIPVIVADVLLEWRRRGLESLNILIPSPSRDILADFLDLPLNIQA